MKEEHVKIREGIVLFEGKISRNLMFDPMVSNTYLLEDGEEVIVFDPSCGKRMVKKVNDYIRKRHQAEANWKKAFIIAGHSHMDHASNFYLSDLIEADEIRIYVHENGFLDGKVKNEPAAFIKKVTEEIKKYYNPYLSFYAPYKILMFPFAILDALSPDLATRVFSAIGAVHWPTPRNGSIQPEPLRKQDAQMVDLGDVKIRGWWLGDKVVLATPGHSPCSVSLLWPEKKALFTSDADWIGNPVFMSSSLKDCISSLEKLKYLSEVGKVDLLLPAHGLVKEGAGNIMGHLDFHIRRLEVMRSEILSAYCSSGQNKDVRKLTKTLVQKSPLFKMLKQSNYPRLVVFVHNFVTLSLREEGILQ